MRGRRLEKTGSVFAEYVEDFYGPRTTQMPADHLPQQNGITQTGSEAGVGKCCGGVCTASGICGLAV